jgi:hypothetical protein
VTGWRSVQAQTAEAPATQPQAEQVAADYNKKFNSYRDLRAEVLNLMGRAKQKIWLSSNFFTDGEIVTALFLAKYRKIDIRVLVDEKKATHYMSRVYDLKKNNMTVALQPQAFAFKSGSHILIDEEIFHANADLNYMQSRNQFALTRLSSAQWTQFVDAFNKAEANSPKIIVKPLPQVGREYRKQAKAIENFSSPSSSRTPSDVYHYGRKGLGKRKIPEGVVTKLPKATIYQKNQRQAVEKQLQGTGGASSAPSARGE